jgi:hypothetical protein
MKDQDIWCLRYISTSDKIDNDGTIVARKNPPLQMKSLKQIVLAHNLGYLIEDRASVVGDDVDIKVLWTRVHH